MQSMEIMSDYKLYIFSNELECNSKTGEFSLNLKKNNGKKKLSNTL